MGLLNKSLAHPNTVPYSVCFAPVPVRHSGSRDTHTDLPCSPSRGYLSGRRSRGRDYTISLAAPAMSFKLTMGMSPF